MTRDRSCKQTQNQTDIAAVNDTVCCSPLNLLSFTGLSEHTTHTQAREQPALFPAPAGT